MKPLLFLSQRIPYPPNKGDKLRSFAVLKHLSQRYRVHLGCFIDDPDDWRHVEAVRAYCADVCCIGLTPRWGKARSLLGLLEGRSLSEVYFRSARLSRWVDRVMARDSPDTAFLYSSVMGHYLPTRRGARPARVVMDFVDVDSVKWRQYADTHRWPLSALYRREHARLLAFDRAVAARCDAAVFVSQQEAALFQSLAPEVAGKVHAITNGVDLAFFSPEAMLESPFEAGTCAIVMTGAMDYWPNIDGARWFAREVFPAIRAAVPAARFFVVGANPSPEVQSLAKQPGLVVTGRVADVRPYLAHAAVVVAPLRVARGIQNKVLEGMAMARVVVTTPQGLEGIEAVPGRHLLMADDDRAFIKATLGVLRGDPGTDLGAAARACVVGHYGWPEKLAAYEALLAAPVRPDAS